MSKVKVHLQVQYMNVFNYYKLPVLNVVISGAADVEIIEERYGYGNSYGHRHYRNIYKADEQYMSQVINLLGRTTMPPGRLVYPFQCPLPMDNLPCTYQAQYGNINYQVSAHLGTFSEMDIREAVPILVGPMLDLNRISLIGYEPAEYTDAIEVGGGCCTRGKAIRLQISVPKRHFIPGEILRFTVVVDNKSNRVLNGTAMRLVLTVTCSAQGTDRRHETNVIAMAGPDIKANSVTVWEVNDFMVPTGLLPSFLGGCNIIRAEYSLQVIIKVQVALNNFIYEVIIKSINLTVQCDWK